MKKQLTAFALVLGMVVSFGATAQTQTPAQTQTQGTQKIGHINADQLLQMMPETKAAQAQLEQYSKQLEKDMREMEQELQSKYDTLVKNQAMMTNLTKETKRQELEQLQMRIQNYSEKAQSELQQKQVDLLTPIIERATAAVKKVAEENGFSYILDSSQSKAVVVYAQGGIDIMPLVKKELGLE